ncbi:NUDIX hydrolase [Roseivirga sp. E12]|uniref:NUDIX hydrolase n=1 Tax=Roseivirga sp. E12 TaxID=2819237 RepID=UPI001F285187|nr:NUDIX hydrolase [Roseivirga sp. E12]
MEDYQSSYEAEMLFRKQMIDLLKYKNCFERSLLHAHFTASTWVVDAGFEYALLTHHAKLDRWLQLGGHADGEENLRIVAETELSEESGLKKTRFYSEKIFDIDIHTIPERKEVPEHDHYDVRFLFVGDMEETIQKNHESKDVAWKSFKEIPTLCNGNDSILRMIEKCETIRRKM